MSTQTNCPPDAIIDLSVPTYFTQGSVLFTGAGGIISQNNASFSWDNTNKALSFGYADPVSGILRGHNFGAANTFLGYNAGNFTMTSVNLVSGFSNTGFGTSALTSLTTGYNNAAFGYALPFCSSGFQNTAIGDDACQALTTSRDNTAIGYNTLTAITTIGRSNYNVAVGSQAGQNKTDNTLTAVGFQALLNDLNGSGNTAIGFQCLNTLTAGNGNTGVGDSALMSNTSSFNVAMGYCALQGNSSGSQNTALGYFSGYTTTAANKNLTGTGNTWVGYNSGPSSVTQVSGSIAIGNNAQVSASNMCVLGGTGSDAVSVVIGGTTAARRLEVIDGSAAQLRLTLAAGTVYCDVMMDGSGNINFTNTGGPGHFFTATSPVVKIAGAATNQLLSLEMWDNGTAGTRKGRFVYAGNGGGGSKYIGILNDAADFAVIASDTLSLRNLTGFTEAFGATFPASVINISFFGATKVPKQTRGATFTNNITVGGTTDSPANWTDLTIYANDAAAIRNAIYQLARVVNQYDVAFRAYGLLT